MNINEIKELLKDLLVQYNIKHIEVTPCFNAVKYSIIYNEENYFVEFTVCGSIISVINGRATVLLVKSFQKALHIMKNKIDYEMSK